MISYNHHPDHEGVIDQFLDGVYGLEVFNHHANAYAMEVVHHYFGEFSDEWYWDFIGTEDFRGFTDKELLKKFERMYDLYWDARGEWLYKMIANLNTKNIAEATRNMYQHTLTTPVMWKDYGSNFANGPIVTHQLDDK